MPISDRIELTIERWSGKWKDRLKGWAAGTLGFGFEVFADVLAKSMAPKLKPIIDMLEKTGKVPPELQPILNEIKNPTGESAAAFGLSASGPLIGGAIGRIADAILLPIAYAANSVTRNVILGPPQLFEAELRGKITTALVNEYLGWLGYEQKDIDIWRDSYIVRFPSDVVGPAWLRDKAKYEKYWDDVKAIGVSSDRLELLKEIAHRIPGVQDIIRYVVKEAYAPEIYKAFGQDQEYPSVAEADALKSGVRPDMLLKEWIAHWDLPSVGQGFEMLHRGEITPEQLTLLLKAKDIMPFWRDKLTAISWAVPGRIEVRMMAQLGLVDKAFIMDILKKDGLAEEYRDIVADMNLVRGVRTDIQTRYTKGWIDSEGVKSELAKTGLSPQIADRLYQWIVINVKAERTQKERDLTDAEIVKAVKLGEITWADGVAIFRKRGFDEDEANLKLAIGIPVQAETLTDVQTIKIDTIRRQRRARAIGREEEVRALIALQLSPELANTYADNDELRLAKPITPEAQAKEEAMLSLKIKAEIETIRLQRRQRIITRNDEITALVTLGLSPELATAYADYDELRLVAVKVVPPVPVVLFYHTETGKAQADNVRLSARQRKITRQQEIDLLIALEMSEELATAYADNDELRLVKVAEEET